MGCSLRKFPESSDESHNGLCIGRPLTPRKLNFENSRITSSDETYSYYAKPERCDRSRISTELLKRSPAFRKPDRKYLPITPNNQTDGGYTPPTLAYYHCGKHLHETFSLPEAVTGQFSSPSHPANIYKGDCECMSAPKHGHGL